MKVAFDISVLGTALRFEKARTGIHRVINHLAHGLAVSNTVEARWCAECDLSSAYLAVSQSSTLSTKPFVYRSIWGERKLKRFTHTRGLGRLARRIRRTEFFSPFHSCDIYHSPWGPIPDAVRNRSSVKKFFTSYDLIPLKFPQYVEPSHITLIENCLASITTDDFVCCISEATREDLLDYKPKLNPANVFVTPLAPAASFRPIQDTAKDGSILLRYGVQPSVPFFLSVCTLEPRKNLEHTVECFLRATEAEGLDDLHLVLVGTKGWKIDKFLDSLEGAKRRIILTGFVPDEDLNVLYNFAEAFLFMSHYEGFGLPPLEAMSCGLPVIASNTSSLPEVVGNAGILLSPTDSDGLCQAIVDIHSDSDLRDKLSHQALARSQQFSWKKFVDSTIAAYQVAAST